MFNEQRQPPLSLKEAILDANWDENSHAIEGVDGRMMTHGQLRSKISQVVGMLNGAGYRRGDRFAIVLSNGPEQFAASIVLMAGFTVVPLNPNCTFEESARYMKGAGAKAVVVEEGAACPAREVARSLGLEIFELTKEGPSDTVAFCLKGEGIGGHATKEPEFATEDDLIAVFGTSGTTSRPKLVPLRQSNVLWAQFFYQKNFRDTSSDRCLVLLPLFYSHGLLTPLQTLFCGGCVVFAPSFDPVQFYKWLDRSKATWMVAGPTTYNVILEKAKENAEIIARNQLRFISTGNAAMPLMVMEELERVFGVPVIETYAMTEANIITSNLLPPGRSKRRSAGISWGTEVAIMDDHGSLLPNGKIGEVVVRGNVVMRGYENDPEANKAAFVEGWFRTGDLGYLEEDGYLHLRGRVKEMINKGGEKVAPQEIDNALMEHPAVAEAVAFPVPHQALGEDIDAAVVLRGGQQVTDGELRSFLFDRLAYFKVPTRIIFVNEIPKGATGKANRSDMARALGLL